MKTHYIIYKITNNVNNKIYIGCHQTDNLDDGYMGSGKYLRHAYKKYGIDKFRKEILYDFSNEEEMFNMEKQIVNEDFIKRDNTYNITEGGNGGWKHCADSVRVIDKNGKKFRVKKDDERLLSGELTKTYKGYSVYINKEKHKIYTSNNDQRVISGEYIHLFKNKIAVKDNNKNIFFISIKDPEYLEGKYVGVSKNKIVVKDKKNKYFSVSIDDPRYLSGEYVFNWTGKKHRKETLEKIKRTMAEHNHSQGNKNPNFGKHWIYNLKLKKCITVKDNDLEQYVKIGWVKGRKMRFN